MTDTCIEHDGRNSLVKYNGTITVENTETGGSRTFKITTSNFGSEEKPDLKRIVGLLSGPDNGSDYVGFGFVDHSGCIAVWKKKRGQDGEKSDWQKFARILCFPELYPQLNYMFSISCRRCGRELTTPESIRLGVGPICAEKGM